MSNINDMVMYLESLEYNIEEGCPIALGQVDLVEIEKIKKFLLKIGA